MSAPSTPGRQRPATGLRGRPAQRRRAALAAIVLSAVLLLLISVVGFGETAPPARPVQLSTYDAAVLADHPAAFWDMRASGGREADLTGHGHTGSYRPGPPPRSGLPDGEPAATFTRRGQYMTVRSSSRFSIGTTRALSWEGWIRPDVLRFSHRSDPQSYGYVDWMGKCQNYSPGCEWEARMYSAVNRERRCDRLSAYVFNSDAGLGSAADWQPRCNLIAAGQWLYVVGEYQTSSTPRGCKRAYPGAISIWVDGVKQNFADHIPTGCMSEYDITPRAGRSPLNIGTMARDTWFPGAVGKVAIYDTLLSQAQIDVHYTAMTGARPSGSCAYSCAIPAPTSAPRLPAP
jgi:hypothetical protein